MLILDIPAFFKSAICLSNLKPFVFMFTRCPRSDSQVTMGINSLQSIGSPPNKSTPKRHENNGLVKIRLTFYKVASESRQSFGLREFPTEQKLQVKLHRFVTIMLAICGVYRFTDIVDLRGRDRYFI